MVGLNGYITAQSNARHAPDAPPRSLLCMLLVGAGEAGR